MPQLFAPLPATATTRRRENTRQRLVRASLAVFVDKGIDGATIDDLVKAAGFTRGAFYSSFSTKLELFGALFEDATDQVIGIIEQSVAELIDQEAQGEGCPVPRTDAEVLVGVFEAIRPYGRQWYLLYSEAVAYSLRDDEGRAQLSAQRTRVREVIAAILERGMQEQGERSLIPVQDLAQLILGIFVDLMVLEHLEETDTTALASVTILGTLRAFIAPAEPR
ncbi:TetR/AcrR family transcriptional regulator [Brachybacterium hainanense]|uniref:TetR/AcrR family transcriptional regulator n=1 Tax=Brachybacterium hainanense TaxID=1541174 RepID=A0ABV6RBI7_9MICO